MLCEGVSHRDASPVLRERRLLSRCDFLGMSELSTASLDGARHRTRTT